MMGKGVWDSGVKAERLTQADLNEETFQGQR